MTETICKIKGEKLGNIITDELASNLRYYTTKFDMANVANKSVASKSLIQRVVYQDTPLTDYSEPAILLLIDQAIKNCEIKSKDALKAMQQLQIKIASL